MSPEAVVFFLQGVQWLGYLGTCTLVSFGLYDSYSQRHASSSSSPSCSCALIQAKPRPYCDLTETTADRSKYNVLFALVCLWLGLISLTMLIRELAGNRSRALSSFVFVFQGSLLLAVGYEFNQDLGFLVVGALDCALALVLLGSIPACRRQELDDGENGEEGKQQQAALNDHLLDEEDQEQRLAFN